MSKKYIKVNDDWELADALHQEEEDIRRHAFLGMNLTAESELALKHTYTDCLFLGCSLPVGFKRRTKDSLFFPNMGELFHLCSHLYTADELYEGYEVGQPETYQQCFDGRVYRHYLKKGKRAEDIKETLARTMHDHSISDCMHEFLSDYDERHVVGVMGGHGLRRTDQAYAQIVRLSKRLTEEGFLMVTGGGPGAMEATHLGAWMAGRGELEVMDALHTMRTAPSYTDEGWLDTAMRIRSRYPSGTITAWASPPGSTATNPAPRWLPTSPSSSRTASARTASWPSPVAASSTRRAVQARSRRCSRQPCPITTSASATPAP